MLLMCACACACVCVCVCVCVGVRTRMRTCVFAYEGLRVRVPRLCVRALVHMKDNWRACARVRLDECVRRFVCACVRVEVLVLVHEKCSFMTA